MVAASHLGTSPVDANSAGAASVPADGRWSATKEPFGIGSEWLGRGLKKALSERRTIVFIDESGLSERPHRVRTWAPRGQTPAAAAFYEPFFLRSAQRRFIAKDNRLLPSGVMPPRRLPFVARFRAVFLEEPNRRTTRLWLESICLVRASDPSEFSEGPFNPPSCLARLHSRRAAGFHQGPCAGKEGSAIDFMRKNSGGSMRLSSEQDKRRYWVVSTNVQNEEATVPDWRAASVVGHAAFMGYGPEDRDHNGSGYKFAHEVKPGDRIVIARRHNNEPEIVGLGIVRGGYQRSLPGTKLPSKPGSLRRLSRFLPCSRAVSGVPLMSALKHTKALAELHPAENKAHKQVCDWLERKLKSRGNGETTTNGSGRGTAKGKNRKQSKRVRVVGPPGSFQEDYAVRTTAQVKTAKRREAKLVRRYVEWLERQGRALSTVLYGKLRCDAYEEARRNLIEAKRSA